MRGIVKTFPGVRALDGVDLVVRPGRGALPARPERCRQVHADQGAGGRPPSRRGRHRVARRAVTLSTPGHRDLARHLHDLPGARPRRRAERRGEHLPRPREVARRPAPSGRHPRAARALLARLGHEEIRVDREVGHPAGVRPADRQHGAGPLPRHPADRDGRAVRGPRPAGGADAVPGDPRPDLRGRRGRLHLPPARGDPPGRRPGHGAQGRPHRRHRPPGPRHPHLRPDPADDRPRHRVRLPAARRRSTPLRRPCSRSRASASRSRSPTCPSRCAPARSSGWPAWSAPAARRSSSPCTAPAGRRAAPSRSTASACGAGRSAPRSGPGSGSRPRSARARACSWTRRSTRTSRSPASDASPGPASSTGRPSAPPPSS